MRAAIAAAVLAAGLTAACNDTRPYAGTGDKNLQIKTTVARGQISLDVFKLDSGCKAATYEGAVALDQPMVEVGLPVGRPSLLVFEFRGSTSIKKEVQLVPRAGIRYEANVAYTGAIHDIELREIDPRTGTYRELEGRRGC